MLGGGIVGSIVAGVHVKSGSLNIAVVELGEKGDLGLVSASRIHPNSALSDAKRLADLADRFRQHLSPMSAVSVAILDTRAFSNWKYVEAFARTFAICAVLQGSSALSIEATTYRTNKVGESVSLQPNNLKVLAYGDVGAQSAPKYWTTGMSEAAAVAIHGCRVTL